MGSQLNLGVRWHRDGAPARAHRTAYPNPDVTLRRLGKLTRVLLGLAALAIAIASAVRRPGETVGQVAIEQCRAAYARASTRGESTAAGRLRPITGRGGATTALTCDAIRQQGWLR